MKYHWTWIVMLLASVVVGCSADDGAEGASALAEADVSIPGPSVSAADVVDAASSEEEETQEPVDTDCVVLTNEGCIGDEVCCDYDGNLTCVPPGTCKTVSGTCTTDEDCGAGLECCTVEDLEFSQCVQMGSCPENGETGSETSTETGGGEVACSPGTCAGSYLCCLTGVGDQICLMPNECNNQGGVEACGGASDCAPGQECCDATGGQGCYPVGTCGGAGTGGGGTGGTGGGSSTLGGPCESEYDCGPGEECCVDFLAQSGTCGELGSCAGGGLGGGGGGVAGAPCQDDSECGSGEACCEFLPGAGATCNLDFLCDLVSGIGGGTGGGPAGECEDTADCDFGQVCCEAEGGPFGGAATTSCKAACDEGIPIIAPGETELTTFCSDDAECGLDQTCCDAYGTGEFCAPTAWCEGGEGTVGGGEEDTVGGEEEDTVGGEEEDTAGGTGDCPNPGDIPDCDGACFPEEFPTDSFCDDGSGAFLDAANFNCEEFNFDNGACGDATTTGGDDDATGGDDDATGGDEDATGGDEQTAGGDEQTAGGDEQTAGGDEITSTTYTVTTSGLNFSPKDLVIAVGDVVSFEMNNAHNVLEVSEDTYNVNGTVGVPDGFSVDKGETKEVTFTAAGVYYYVCTPHALMGMKGTITVE